MSLAWPLALALVLLVPLVLGAYLWTLRRRRRQAVRYPSVALLRSAMPKGSRWRRHVPVALLLAGLAVLGLASSRPQIAREVPIGRTSIILALDVSRSMCSTDVAPNRLTVAQEAARGFVENQADGTRLGIVVFSGFAQLVVPPTTDRGALIQAIDGLTTARGTAIGSAILASLDAIAEVNPDVEPVGDAPTAGPGEPGQLDGSGGPAQPGTAGGTSGMVGTSGFVPDIVVLLTDGANTRGIEPLDAAPYAAARRVRVYTIGFGTTEPASMVCSSAQLGGDALGDMGGGGGFGGGDPGMARSPLVADDATLQAVADGTGGIFYRAGDTDQLETVFDELPKDVDLQTRQIEITAVFAALGALLAGAAIVASIRWSPYP